MVEFLDTLNIAVNQERALINNGDIDVENLGIEEDNIKHKEGNYVSGSESTSSKHLQGTRCRNDDLEEGEVGNIEIWIPMEKEEAFWRQKASSKFLVEGDRNTAYFHNIANHNKVSRHIHKITLSEGDIIEDPDLIASLGVDFFGKLFNSNFALNLNTDFSFIQAMVSEEDNYLLTKTPSVEEIWDNLNSMNSDSVVGPNGFNNKFLQKSWEIIKEDLINAVVDFFNGY
ncbi:uncharacterized protein LOC110114274 [Dendrobium catenatum]|uniref:uncharacterized protein LOC110114274 n=1 Tax=Dendrobium catenatum TaxID=906689 RepID=UPI0009F53F69|nr:uncharacterized protein LOC110114274 [Dendrobium catenatum]